MISNKIKYLLVAYILFYFSISNCFSYSIEYFYDKQLSNQEYVELPDIIDYLSFDNCSWQFITNELNSQLYAKSINNVIINRADSVSIELLSVEIMNIKSIAVNFVTKIIHSSNSFTSELEALSIIDSKNNIIEYLPFLQSFPKLVYASFTLNINNKYLDCLIDSLNNNCKKLQYLSLSVLKDIILPKSVENLTKLNYLSLCFENGYLASLIPVCLLRNLNTLRIIGIKNYSEVFTSEFMTSATNLDSLLVDCNVKNYLDNLWSKTAHFKIICER